MNRQEAIALLATLPKDALEAFAVYIEETDPEQTTCGEWGEYNMDDCPATLEALAAEIRAIAKGKDDSDA